MRGGEKRNWTYDVAEPVCTMIDGLSIVNMQSVVLYRHVVA